MSDMKAADLEAGLETFSGTENYHRLSILSKLLFTDGCRWLAENAGAYWLMDAIASHQQRAMKDPMLRQIQFWELTRNSSGTGATLTCYRDEGDKAFAQRIPYTDFPLKSVKIWVEGGVVMLPGER